MKEESVLSLLTARRVSDRPSSLLRSPLLRIALVRYVDALYYEAGDVRRCHRNCYLHIVRDLWGISENTFRYYLRYPSERLSGVEIPPRLSYVLRFYVLLVKSRTNVCDADDRAVADVLRFAAAALQGRSGKPVATS